jgi:hypothetical protein
MERTAGTGTAALAGILHHCFCRREEHISSSRRKLDPAVPPLPRPGNYAGISTADGDLQSVLSKGSLDILYAVLQIKSIFHILKMVLYTDTHKRKGLNRTIITLQCLQPRPFLPSASLGTSASLWTSAS